MCGLAGFLGRGSWNDLAVAPNLLRRMADAIISRGPDDWDVWHNPEGIGFAFRRLSILDLSPAGRQPMTSKTGRYVVTFNGEIYNHLDLRDELQSAGHAPAWRGHSDTETLLAGFDAWGVRATIERCVGMFAIALWDKQERTLTLARDRMGEKPLYYGWQGKGESACFLFGSDLKALRMHPAFVGEIDRGALGLLMRHNYIDAPHSIYQGIFKLPPACLLTVSLARREPKVESYWSLLDVAQAGAAAPLTGTETQVIDELARVLGAAVRQQMLSDVPLGAFLSGGIDSSTIVALMQAHSNRPVKTFSIGFEESGYDEAPYAKTVAQHLHTDHTELYVTPQQARDVIPELPALYSEPFSDSSQIPTVLVAKLARQQVTVALSGDAGDELFGGYNRYVLTRGLWHKVMRVPRPLRGVASAGLGAVSPGAWDALLAPLKPLLPSSLRSGQVGDKLHKGAGVLCARSVDELYLSLVTHWEPDGLVLGAREPTSYLRGNVPPLRGLDAVQRMMALDTVTYLPGDILVKVDRAAMGVSLETRVPLLDHRVVELAWRIPQAMKLRAGVSKWVLREVLYRHVPKRLIERPKMGFGVPIDGWLRGPLRDWAETLLSESRLKQEGYFNPTPIREKWVQHLSGKRNWQYHLWDVLMFQAWLAAQK